MRNRSASGAHVPLDDDAIWRHPERGWNEWGVLLHTHPTRLARRATRAGWCRTLHGAIIAAPCKRCGHSTPRAQLDVHRICLACRITGDPNVRRYHVERWKRWPDRYDASALALLLQ